jgi:hypothetical protein
MAWLKDTRQKAQNFFGKLSTSLPNAARSSLKFLNGTVIPGAVKANRLLSNVSKAVEEDPNISKKYKEKVAATSKFAGIGLTKLEQGTESTNRIAKAVGLD